MTSHEDLILLSLINFSARGLFNMALDTKIKSLNVTYVSKYILMVSLDIFNDKGDLLILEKEEWSLLIWPLIYLYT